jgi:hypothetical protein
MEAMKIEGLAMRAVEAAMAIGLSPYIAWEEHAKVYEPIVVMHKTRGEEYLDPEIVNEYVDGVERRFDCGEIKLTHYGKLKRGARRLIEFYQNGKMEWSRFSKVSKFKLNPYYEGIICDFLSASDFHPNTQGDIVWISRKYFAWLISEGKHDLHGVGAKEVQGFIVYCSRHMTVGSIHNTKLYLKKLYRYLADCGLSVDNHEELLSLNFPTPYNYEKNKKLNRIKA